MLVSVLQAPNATLLRFTLRHSIEDRRRHLQNRCDLSQTAYRRLPKRGSVQLTDIQHIPRGGTISTPNLFGIHVACLPGTAGDLYPQRVLSECHYGIKSPETMPVGSYHVSFLGYSILGLHRILRPESLVSEKRGMV